MTNIVSMTVKETTEELFWKTKDGSLVPISQLTLEQIQEAKRFAKQKIEFFYPKYELFSNLLEALDNRLDWMEDKLQSEYEMIKRIKQDC